VWFWGGRGSAIEGHELADAGRWDGKAGLVAPVRVVFDDGGFGGAVGNSRHKFSLGGVGSELGEQLGGDGEYAVVLKVKPAQWPSVFVDDEAI